MESKKINQLATAVNPSTSDLAIIGDPVTGVSKKITWLQVSTLIGTAANLQQVTDNGATTTNPVTIGGLTITGLSTGVLKSDSGVISSVPFGAANGVATLAGDGKVPSSQLPSYVDDVVEVANYAALPVTGETGKIYITLDNNKVYRWGGSVYVEVAANQAVWGSITGTLANQTDLQNVLNLKATDSLVVHLAGTETITGTKTFSNASKNDGGILLQNGSSYSLSGYMNLGGMTDGLRFTSGGGISNFFTLPSSVGYTYTFPALSGTIVAISGGNSTQYIDGTGALQTFPTLISSDKLVKLVRNQSGATMTAGTIVYISGATGNKPLITKALATGDSTSAQTYGLVQADIANNADGYVVVIGNITDIDTSALTEGQQLYLSGTTAGAYTTTKPYAPIHLVYIGIVLRSHPTQGIIGVKIQNGYEMDELHNVDAQSPSNNDILSYNTSTSLWEHKQIATTLGFTPISLASLSATSPLSYNNTTGAFSIQVATASQNGYLSSTDWSTFNNKQAALGGTGFVKISGSTISYDNSTYYLASNPSAFITLTSLSAGDGISYSNTTGVISSTITQYTDALARAAISSSATGLTYTSATGVFSLTAGYAIPTTAKQTEWDTAYTNRITSLTTTGSSGSATLVSNTLNVPTYTLSGLGGQPLDADLTAIAGLTGTSGFLKKNAADTWSLDTNTYVTTTTAQTISGAKTFSASPIIDGGFATAIPLRFKQYDSASFNSDGYTDLYVMNAYRFGFAFNQGSSNYKGFTFNVNGITLNTSREYTMPNASGTLALTSDIVTYTLPTASTTILGGVKVDGTTITINGSGVISGANTYSLPIATASVLGGVKIGTGIGVDVNGVISVTGVQSQLNGTGFVKATGTTISYDNSTYLTTSSASSTYVPYTGATTDVSLGNNTLLSKFVFIEGDGTQGGILSFKQYATSWTSTTNHTNIYATDTDKLNFNFYQVGGGKSFTFNVSGLTAGANRTYTMPDAAGTLALTSDIPSLSGYVTIGTTQTITGTKTFSANTFFSANININGTANDGDIAVHARATAGAGKYIYVGRDSSDQWKFSVRSDGFTNVGSGTSADAKLLTIQSTGNNLDTGAVIRLVGNDANDLLDISVADTTSRIYHQESSADAASGYGLIQFRTNASANGDFPLRGGFKFTSNDGDALIITNQRKAFFNNTIQAVNSVKIFDASYLSAYATSLRTATGAVGVLQLGNNNDNYILAGNSGTGGYLDIRVNCASESITAGTLALRINTNAIAAFSNNVGIGSAATNPLSNLHVSNIDGGNYTGTFRIGGSEAQFGMVASYNQAASTLGSIYVSPSYNSSSVLFKLGTGLNNTNQIVMKGNGFVGINTDAPVGLFTIKRAYTSGTTPMYFGNTSFTAWNRQAYDTLILQQDDVTSFRMVEKNGETEGSDQILAFSIGDGSATIATSAQPLKFFINGSPTGITYQGLSGTEAMRINTNGNIQMFYTLTCSGDVIAYSDLRLKTNIETINNANDLVSKMRGVFYNRKDTEDKSRKVGVIAQEMQKILPEVVSVSEDGTLGVAYGNIVAVLIEAVKNQQEQINDLKKQIA